MSDDLVRYRQEEVHLGGGDVEYRYVESKDGWIASYVEAKAALDAQAAEITRLRAELATGRQDGMEQAAQIALAMSISSPSVIAAAIRAAAKEVKP